MKWVYIYKKGLIMYQHNLGVNHQVASSQPSPPKVLVPSGFESQSCVFFFLMDKRMSIKTKLLVTNNSSQQSWEECRAPEHSRKAEEACVLGGTQ